MTDALLVTILRTTCCTALAAMIARFLLRRRTAKSPAIHRLVWCLVLLQGWAFVPLAVAIPALHSGSRSSDREALPTASTSFPARFVDATRLAVPTIVSERATFNLRSGLLLAWFAGMAIAIAYSARQYLSIIRNVPLGREPIEPEWRKQWNDLAHDFGVESRARFRITDEVGPLCCFVPFFYLILAPERLWRSFQPRQRKFVLMHELAHVIRGDLWKSLAIRVLALPQWFNPFAWRAVCAFDEAAEWACDDFVVGDCRSALLAYSASLLEIAESHFHPIAGSVGVRGGVLTERVSRLIEQEFMEEKKMKRLLITVMFVLMFTAQSIRVVDAEPFPQQSQRERPRLSDGQNETESIKAREARKADLERTGLVPYRVAPPDILFVDAVRLTPKMPYRIEISDRLQIVASGLPQERPIAGSFPVNTNGAIDLGATYKSVTVVGSTIEEAQVTIAEYLRQTAPDAQVSVSLQQAAVVRQVAGEHIVAPDGRLYLGVYGSVPVSGMTTAEMRTAVERYLSKYFDEPQLSVEVQAHNSKVCYVIVEQADGDDITRLPAKENDTVWDAIVRSRNERNLTNKQVWISRRVDGGSEDDILPVEWQAIAKGEATRTNYELLPGDRVFVSQRLPNEKKVTPRAPDGGVTLPVLSTSDYTVAQTPSVAQVVLQVEAYRDPQGNLAEYWVDKGGDAILVNHADIQKSLYILKKNRGIEPIATPRILFPVGQCVTLETEELRVDAKASLTTDNGTLLAAKITCGPYTGILETHAVLRQGQALLLRTGAESGTYVVLTTEVRRYVDTGTPVQRAAP